MRYDKIEKTINKVEKTLVHENAEEFVIRAIDYALHQYRQTTSEIKEEWIEETIEFYCEELGWEFAAHAVATMHNLNDTQKSAIYFSASTRFEHRNRELKPLRW